VLGCVNCSPASIYGGVLKVILFAHIHCFFERYSKC
jgi:hypothetical protein